MSISAMKKALEALENYVNVVTSSNDPNDFGGVVDGGEPARKACDVLRQAIAEAEKQEPDDLTIAYMSGFHDGKKKRKWVGLTDKEVTSIIREWHWMPYELCKAIEAKLKEKNK